ncbi:MAG: hypothetical protein B7Y39_15840 [Bdellovibrio sp. 28-41-41]|nr:MAG: hypothetical protein B7Y39_15840 [Bdellovibrio sp. 28-41-41]
MILKAMIVGVLTLSLVHAAPKPVEVVEAPITPEMVEAKWDPAEFKEVNKAWNKTSRKIASDLKASDAFKTQLMDPWLQVTNSEQLYKLLVDSYKGYDRTANPYAPDVKYFLNHLHTMIPLKGIVWRMRPIFEVGGLGNKSTHMSAIQFIRGIATGLAAGFPTQQTRAMTDYFTMPGVEMTEASQFKSIEDFQNFLVDSFIPYLENSSNRIAALTKANPGAVFVWDNQMYYGTASFKNGFNRYVGHGLAEMHISMATLNESIHDSLMFSAYNQKDLIEVAGDLGRKFGIDIVKGIGWNEIGVTDKERSAALKKYVEKENGFLSLRTYGMLERAKQKLKNAKVVTVDGKPKELGEGLVWRAYGYKVIAVNHFNDAYTALDGKAANASMALNPAIYQKDVQNRLNEGVSRMKDAIEKPTDFNDPISSEVVRLDVPNFYKNPPKSLKVLMAKNWEGSTDDKEGPYVTNVKGKKLHYRNYFAGRSTEWDNAAWGQYVTSANGKDAGYMMTAKRVMHYSLGATPVFGVVDIFVR